MSSGDFALDGCAQKGAQLKMTYNRPAPRTDKNSHRFTNLPSFNLYLGVEL